MLTFPASETRLSMDDVSWETYVALADGRRESVPRIFYDRGLMELMSPKKEHEKIKTLLGRLIAAYAEAVELDIDSVASTTFRREDLQRGFETDESFYVVHANSMRAREEIDLSTDPPPELVVEVEMISSAIRKLELFAKLGIGEVWRHDGEQLRLFHLDGHTYREASQSRVLPGFPLAQAQAVLAKRNQEGEIALVKAFRLGVEASRSD